MTKESNYQSPVCVLLKVYTEGFLCSSVDGFYPTNESNETFKSLNDFNW